MTKDEALELALEALEALGTAYLIHSDAMLADKIQQAIAEIAAMRAQLQPEKEPVVCCGDYATCMKSCTPRGRWLAEQEPVGFVRNDGEAYWIHDSPPPGTDLYTTPPKEENT
jgi:hypothetical protein